MGVPELPQLAQYELHWRSGGHHGRLRTWAPTARSAIRSVRDHPSMHGIPHESVLIDRCREVTIRPQGTRAAA